MAPDPAAVIQEVLGCKWSIAVIGCVRSGPLRPSDIARAIPGLSHKVLHDRLAKLLRLRFIERTELAPKQQRVEYRLTDLGREVDGILSRIAALDISGSQTAQRPSQDDRRGAAPGG